MRQTNVTGEVLVTDGLGNLSGSSWDWREGSESRELGSFSLGLMS